MRIKEKSNDNVISDRSIRDKCVGHYEVLERFMQCYVEGKFTFTMKYSDKGK